MIGALSLKPASNMQWLSNGAWDSAIQFYVWSVPWLGLIACLERAVSLCKAYNKVRAYIPYFVLKMPMHPPLPPPQPANVRNSNMAHLNPLPPSVFTLTQTAQLEALYTIIRDKETSRGDFLFYSDRVIRLLVEEGLNHLPVVSRTVETPTVSWLPKIMTFSLRVGNGTQLSSDGNTNNSFKINTIIKRRAD